jgi:hypothetical protein
VTGKCGVKLAKATGPKVVVAPPGLFVECRPCGRDGLRHIQPAGVGTHANYLLCDRTHVVEDLVALCWSKYAADIHSLFDKWVDLVSHVS